MEKRKATQNKKNLIQDFYFNDQGLMVFTRAYHLKRGYCCKSNCLNCAYKPENLK